MRFIDEREDKDQSWTRYAKEFTQAKNDYPMVLSYDLYSPLQDDDGEENQEKHGEIGIHMARFPLFTCGTRPCYRSKHGKLNSLGMERNHLVRTGTFISGPPSTITTTSLTLMTAIDLPSKVILLIWYGLCPI